MTPFELFMKLLWPVGAGLTWIFVRPHFGILGSFLLSILGAFVVQIATFFVVAAVTALREKLTKK